MPVSSSSFYNLALASVFGQSETPSAGATTRDPELRKLITELEKIQGRYLLEENKQAVKAEIEVLKAQTKYAAELLDFEGQLATLDQKDADSQRTALVKIRTELFKARADLATERANWNSRAFDAAIRAASDASIANKDPNSAAWQSLSDGLIADQTSTVLDPQLPATLEQMARRWTNGIQFDDDLKITSWGTVQDQDTRLFVSELSRRARAVRASRGKSEASYNDTERSLKSLIAVTEQGTWSGMNQADRDAHVAEIRKQYSAFSGYVTEYDKISPYDKARRKRLAAEAEHTRFEQRADRLDWAWKEYQGTNTPQAQSDRLRVGQAIYEIQDWAKSNGIPVGQAFDDDGDGRVDRYISLDGDAKALMQWQLQLEKGEGKYGIKGGRTGTMVQFEVKASPEQLRYMQDDQGLYSYYETQGGRVYITPSQVAQLERGTEQAVLISATKDGKEQQFIRLPDGRIVDQASEGTDIPEMIVIAESDLSDIKDVALLSSKFTQQIMDTGVVIETDVLEDLKGKDGELELSMEKEPTPTILKTEEQPPVTYTKVGEQMKIHAGDMANHPKGAIRLLGGEVLSKDQITGPVTVLYSEPDVTVFGPEGLWAQRTKEIQQAQASSFAEEHKGYLRGAKPMTRVVGGIEYQDYGLGEVSLLEQAFGKLPLVSERPTRSERQLTQAKERAQEIADLQEEAEYQRKEVDSLKAEGADASLIREQDIATKKLEKELEKKKAQHERRSSDEAKRAEELERSAVAREEPLTTEQAEGLEPARPTKKYSPEEWLYHGGNEDLLGAKFTLFEDGRLMLVSGKYPHIVNELDINQTEHAAAFAEILKTRPVARHVDRSEGKYGGTVYELGSDGTIRYISPEKGNALVQVTEKSNPKAYSTLKQKIADEPTRTPPPAVEEPTSSVAPGEDIPSAIDVARTREPPEGAATRKKAQAFAESKRGTPLGKKAQMIAGGRDLAAEKPRPATAEELETGSATLETEEKRSEKEHPSIKELQDFWENLPTGGEVKGAPRGFLRKIAKSKKRGTHRVESPSADLSQKAAEGVPSGSGTVDDPLTGRKKKLQTALEVAAGAKEEEE